MTAVSASEARSRFAEILNAVGYGKERVLIQKHNRPVAAVVSVEELLLLDELLEVAEHDSRFRERIEELRSTQGHRETMRAVGNPTDSTVLTSGSFATVLDRTRYPRPATQALKDLMAAEGD